MQKEDDKIQRYSQGYIDILEEFFEPLGAPGSLLATWSYKENFDSQSFVKMAEALRDHSLSDEADSVRRAIQSSSTIFSCGIGYAQDFSLFVKLGFILSETQILWDNVLLANIFVSGKVDHVRLCEVVTEWMRLAPLIAQGCIVIMANPREWEPMHVQLSITH